MRKKHMTNCCVYFICQLFFDAGGPGKTNRAKKHPVSDQGSFLFATTISEKTRAIESKPIFYKHNVCKHI